MDNYSTGFKTTVGIGVLTVFVAPIIVGVKVGKESGIGWGIGAYIVSGMAFGLLLEPVVSTLYPTEWAIMKEENRMRRLDE